MKAKAESRVVRVVKVFRVFRVLSAHDPKDLNDSKDLKDPKHPALFKVPEDYAARHVHGGRYFCGKNAKP